MNEEILKLILQELKEVKQSMVTKNEFESFKQSTQDEFDSIRQSMVTKDEFNSFKQSTRDEFDSIRQSMATKDELVAIRQSMATKDELEAIRQSMATKDELEAIRQSMATKEDLEKFATKEDFNVLKLAILELSEKVNVILDTMVQKDDIKYLEMKLIEHDKEIYKFKDFVSLLTSK